jgi:flagellar biosynthetic protein FliO
MEAIEQTMAVAGVLALLLGALWWLRRRGLASPAFPGRRAARRLQTLERAALGPGQFLHLVRIEDRILLLASSPAGCVLIERVAAADPAGIRTGEVR